MTVKKSAPGRAVMKPGGRPAEASVGPRPFEVQLSCPHCAGPFVVSDATVSHVCEHCRSLLIIEAPDREEVFVEPAQITEPAAILEALLQYRIDAHRATLVARHSDEEGNPPPELLIWPLLSRFEKGLRATARIIHCRSLHVPYRHTAAKIVQTVLGRHGDGPKIARLRAYVAEQTSPAYDPARFNLRDAGLRMGRSIFRPLLSADVAKLGRFVPRAAAAASRRDLEKWRGQNLEAGFESVAKQGQVSVTFEATVYRPYYVVRALLDRGEETLLFDGGFGTIAGYMTDEERESFSRGKDPDPLGPRALRSAMSRWSRPVVPIAAWIRSCRKTPWCRSAPTRHAGVSPSAKGLVLVNYEREEGTSPGRDTTLLPFWRFPFEIVMAGLPPLRTLEAYAAAIFPQGIPKGFSAQGDSLYVPAWRLLTTEAGDESFAALAQALHGTARSWTTDRVGLDSQPKFEPVSLTQEAARDLAWATLFSIHTRASSARLNTLLMKRALFDAKLSFGKGAVALLGFAAKDRHYERPEVRVPRLLVDGGPTLAAQRVTVQAAAAAYASAQKRPSMADRVKTSKYSGGEE